MCTYLDFLGFVIESEGRADLEGPKTFLKRDFRTFERCLKTLAHILGVRSEEVPIDAGSSPICQYFNSSPSPGVVKFLSGLDDSQKEVLCLELAGLLKEYVEVGLHPVISNLKFEVDPKEFYSRALALLLNLAVSSRERFKPPVRKEQVEHFPEEGSLEAAYEWRMRILERNLSFRLCRLAVTLCVFGTDEVAIFPNFSDLFRGLLTLFPDGLWVCVLGSIPTLCIDTKPLFSLKSRVAYLKAVSEQYQHLLGILESQIGQNDLGVGDGHPSSQNVNKPLTKSEYQFRDFLVLCNWMDCLCKFVEYEEVCKQSQCNITNSLKSLLDSTRVVSLINTLVSFDYRLCINTLLKMARSEGGMVFLLHSMFNPALDLEFTLELLSRLGLEDLSKDELGLTSVMDHLVDGFNGPEKWRYYEIWKSYLDQYHATFRNQHVIRAAFGALLDHMMAGHYEGLQYEPEHFKNDIIYREYIRARRVVGENADEVVLNRNIFMKLLRILGPGVHKEALLREVDAACGSLGLEVYDNDQLSKIEFSMFLVHAMGVRESYSHLYDIRTNNAYVLFNIYLRDLDDYAKRTGQSRLNPDLEEDHNLYLVYYDLDKSVGINKAYLNHFINVTSERALARGVDQASSATTWSFMFSKILARHWRRMLPDVMERFPDISKENFSTFKMYLKNAALYLRIYQSLKSEAHPDAGDHELVSYLKAFDAVVLNSVAMIIRYDQLASDYTDMLKLAFQQAPPSYLTVLEYSYELLQTVASTLLDAIGDPDDQIAHLVVNFLVHFTRHLTVESSWGSVHLEVFVKLVRVASKTVGDTWYLNKFMKHGQGPLTLKNILTLANSLRAKEHGLSVARSALNKAVVDAFLGVDHDPLDAGPSPERTFRNHDFATKQLELVLTSSSARFQIEGQRDHSQLALGTLSLIDLMIYQSFSLLFGEAHLEDCQSGHRGTNGSSGNGFSASSGARWRLNHGSYRFSPNNSHFVDPGASAAPNHLLCRNLLGQEYWMAMEFLANIYMGFAMLPQTKLLLISEYFFLFAALRTGMSTHQVKRRFLTENNLLRSESISLVYELYRAIRAGSVV